MDDTEETTFANRDDPIPILRIPLQDDSDATSENEDGRRSKRESFKSQADKIKSKFEDVKEDMRSGSIQERLLNSFMAQIIPPDDGSESVKDRRSRAYVDRPSFSLPMMSSNFRRFNSRIGIVFVFQNQLIRLFTWKTPTHTLSFLAAYTLICLEPALIPAMPLALIFFFVMIPSFLVRHPPPPYPTEGTLQSSPDLGSITEMESAWSSYAYTAAPVAPARKVRPAPEMSKDFFRNMRDLQNSMEDFSRVHDAAIAVITPYTNFSDEQLSSSVFLVVFVLMNVALISSHLVPWRLVAVLAGWGATCAGHPRAQDLIHQARKSRTLKDWQHATQTWVRRQIEYDIALYEPPEIREVEVFELQRRQNRSSSFSMRSPTDPYHDRNNSDASEATEEPQSACDADDENWEAWLFTPSPHDPLCPQRLSGAWPTGTQFFEEVHPPHGWIWKDKKWTLDLLSEAWVEERCVTGVEVEREGGRWVYDIGYAEEYGQARKKKSKKDKSWEEGMNRGKKGEWRRRRWVRLVERKAIKVSEVD
ncbi:integral peroxisomal membrane peroxin-domain-containing protein [Elsinoe ampelina]|uniref:Integral peroxisomal membrane peroxin-domain-containing protein n=1 Tax=Elsinoe ampelina TaxID=302913 RepID=A0A6A6G4R8_9PEZI|nr:integral peroxisomal membrane peroxin-domain-containing protein [Elsinoe ampelina]